MTDLLFRCLRLLNRLEVVNPRFVGRKYFLRCPLTSNHKSCNVSFDGKASRVVSFFCCKLLS